MDQTLPLIEIHHGGQMTIVSSTINTLKNVFKGSNYDVEVLSLTGKYRTGKSYLLNQISQLESGFMTDPTARGCTKGIWTQIVEHPTAPDTLLMLLDTEGTNDPDDDDGRAEKLFALVVLISSELVYNTLSTFDSAIFEELFVVTELGRQVQALPDDQHELDERDISLISPRLSFVFRDSFLDFEMTPDNYLEEKFKLRDNPKSKKQKESNDVKSKVRNYFTKRKLFLLCRPVEKEEKLRDLSSIPDEEIREEFKKGIREIEKEVVQNGMKFNIFGINLTMAAWIKLLEHYVKCMNEDKVPVVNDIANIVQEEINREIKEKALEMFRSDVNKNDWPMQPEKFADVIAKAQEKAVELFEKGARSITGHITGFKDAINLEIQAFQRRNEKESKALCEKLLPGCFKDLENNVNQGQYKNNSSSFAPDLTSAQKRYDEHQSKGPMSNQCNADYLNKIEHLENMLAEHIKFTECQAELAEIRHKEMQKLLEIKIKELEAKLMLQLEKKSAEEKQKVLQHFMEEERIHKIQFQKYKDECPTYAEHLGAVVAAPIIGFGTAAGALSGASYGASAGAAVGSVAGPVGTVVGGVVGGVAGAVAGTGVGAAVSSAVVLVAGAATNTVAKGIRNLFGWG